MVERQRALAERGAGEADQADAVVGPLVDEIARGLLRHHQAVRRLEVLGRHARRDIDREHDVDPLGLDLALAQPLLRACHREQREREREPRQEIDGAHQPGADPGPEAERASPQQRGPAPDRRASPDRERRDHQQQHQEPRLFPAHHAACPA